ncbi:hypothetical protein ACFLWI_00620 [Chloroflexota bacterium]
MIGEITKLVKSDSLKVNCYSGHTCAERPKSFLWQGKDYKVEEIEKAWLEPGERHFKIRTGDNKIFRLCYNEVDHQWSLIEPGGGQKDEGNSKNTAK